KLELDKFFFQAEDGIRDGHVTGVQTCALPISLELADVSAFQLERVAAADVGAQRRGNQYRDCHTAFRSSMVMDSSANVPRSSARTQLFGSPARPAPTPTMTYESHGHAWSRSNAEGAGGWSGWEWYTPITSSPS